MRIFKYFLKVYLLFFSLTIFAQTVEENKTQFEIYGFGRTSFIWDNQDLGRTDLFIPANININTTKNPNFFIGAKQSRFGLNVSHKINDNEIKFKLEGDFHNDASDSNGLFRMRHAYVSYKYFLIGMTWSNFFDEDVNPTTVDFEGPNSSTLSRTPQIRFSTFKSKNIWSISLENPLEKLTLSNGIESLPERYPDVIGAYRYNGNFGFIKIASLIREIRYESDKPRSLLGYGLTIMTAVKTNEKNRLKFQGVIGNGISKYIQGASSLSYDAIYNGTNELETLQMSGLNLSYQFYWNEHVFSTLTGGWLGVEDNINLTSNNYKSGYYGSANIFWTPIKNLTFGAEALIGERININNDSGTALRFQMNATYKFDKIF